ncbi:MAG: tetratricopeptide repeat protein, partial [Rhodospirillales bacterium]|nr:tetratricopeptide repeat protein [Rhodospirillales bacterium]
KWDEALNGIKPLAAKKGFKVLMALHSALINELAGRPDAAEKFYGELEKVDGGLSLRLAGLLGGFYERRGNREKAREIYERYLKENPSSVLLMPVLANLKKGGKPPPKSVKSVQEGIAEGMFDLASSLRQQNGSETALIFGQMALYLKPDFPENQALVANMLEQSNRYQRANDVYRSINRTSPISWSARLRLAGNLDRMGREEEAIAYLKAMADEDKKSPDPLIDLGDVLRGKERYEEAVKIYDQAFARISSLQSRHWSLLYARGIALERSKKWNRAEKDFLKALEFEPEQPYVLNYLGYSWVEKGLNLDRAQAMIRKAVELRPNDGYIVDSLGWILYQREDFEGAVKQLERAVELRAEDPIINDHLGDAFWKVGRKQEARFQWRRALSYEPDKELIAGIKKKIADGLPAKSTTAAK